MGDDMNYEAFLEQVAKTIKEQKRQVLCIMADDDGPQFAYTIGNHGKGLPELLLIGPFSPNAVTGILNYLSDKMLDEAKPLEHGQQVTMDGEHPVTIWATTNEAQTNYTIQAGQFYKTEEYEVLQVIVPDPKGRLPTDNNCAKAYRVPHWQVRH